MTHHLGARELRAVRETWSRTWLRIVTDRHQSWAVMPISEGIVQGEFPVTDPIHIITAWNPRCEPHSEQENLRFSEDLADWVDARNLPLWEGTGFASDGGWREEGFALVGLSRKEALEVGDRWGQTAIWEWNSDALMTVDCQGGGETRYGWVLAPLPCRPPFLPGGLVPPC